MKTKILNYFSKRRIHLRIIKWLIPVLFIIVLISNLLVKFSYNEYLYSNIDSLPELKAGLLLGTSKYIKNGQLNPYYFYRLEAAKALYKSGKIKYIIVSGDNRKINYNEPVQMRDDLISLGVAPEAIILDYAGFRTLDSVIRAREIFGQDNFVIISQEFHNQRALYIARQKGIHAIAYNARDVNFKMGLKVQIREVFARVKLMIDLFIINKQPKFLGEKINIGN